MSFKIPKVGERFPAFSVGHEACSTARLTAAVERFKEIETSALDFVEDRKHATL